MESRPSSFSRRSQSEPPRHSHIAIDPFQNSDWKGIGLANVDRAGYRSFLEFHEAPSEFVLPGLASAGLHRLTSL